MNTTYSVSRLNEIQLEYRGFRLLRGTRHAWGWGRSGWDSVVDFQKALEKVPSQRLSCKRAYAIMRREKVFPVTSKWWKDRNKWSSKRSKPCSVCHSAATHSTVYGNRKHEVFTGWSLLEDGMWREFMWTQLTAKEYFPASSSGCC